ncbi:hypothetical protein GFS24_03275 [Chitinophaga sp. SYP-B3965]|uniref:glycoside hydrolase domain-containing protein n=1 Tax=Chitinophaga sp. SYP-B3965 TaxID=2663120 RepID=UPI001299BCCA|nr:glycoside hydrolase domain-containing protein [Chitinophaga sp. SYP-B3965]MRG44116.1 hypothetical protein [Chitinophaga sp. SYP-B3965]
MKHLLFIFLFFTTAASAQLDTVNLSGHKVALNKSGFPEQIQTASRNILAENIHFHIINAATHKDIPFKQEGITIQSDKMKWSAIHTSEQLKMEVKVLADIHGARLLYNIKLTALQDVSLDDIKLHIPFDKSVAKYMKGLGREEGPRPDTINWKWADKYQDNPWVGDKNAGLEYLLHDGFQKPLPTTWVNAGKGGITMYIKGKSMLSENYSGARSMKKNDVLYYNFTLFITP